MAELLLTVDEERDVLAELATHGLWLSAPWFTDDAAAARQRLIDAVSVFERS